MEGKSQNASKNASAPKSIGSSETLPQEVGRQGAVPINTTPQVAGGSGQTTVTLSPESFKMWPEADADLMLAQMGIIPNPPPAVDVQIQETHREETAEGEDKGWGKKDGPVEQREAIQTEATPIRSIIADEPVEEAKQPLFTPEEVAGDLAVEDVGIDKEEMDVEACVDKVVRGHSTEEVEKMANLASGTGGEENPTQRAEVSTGETPRDRDEAARVRAATIHIYQRRPAREETLGKQSTEEQPKETTEMRTEGGLEGPARSTVEPPCRRKRVLIDEDHEEEEEEAIFTMIEALPSSGRADPPAEVKDNDRERRERMRKGKAIATPLKKKPRQASSTLVIQEGRQRIEEDDNEEEEMLRMERRSKRRNDRVRSTSEQRPQMPRIQFKKMQVRLDNDMLGRMIMFDDPK